MLLFEHPALLLAFYDPIFHKAVDARLLNWQVNVSKDFAQRGEGESRHLLVTAPNGSGKCLGAGTPLLMYDGTIKPVEKVELGDWLMGPDSKPRVVESKTSGYGPLFRVTSKRGSNPYVVNKSHILSLKMTRGAKLFGCKPDGVSQYLPNKVINISVDDYLKKSKTFKHCAMGYRTGVAFPRKKVPLDPYFVGVWLGDGSAHTAAVTTADVEIVAFLNATAEFHGLKVVRCGKKNNMASSYYLSAGRFGKRDSRNSILNALRELNLVRNKHVPFVYKANSADVRLLVLAGLIDTDGYLAGGYYDLIFKSQRLADDTAYLARSLGFASMVRPCKKTCCNNGVVGDYFRVSIYGDIQRIPVRISRKKAGPNRLNRDHMKSSIRVEPIGVGGYYGFEVSGPDRLFLLGDFTVTHNSSVVMSSPAIWTAVSFKESRTVITSSSIPQLDNQTMPAVKKLAGQMNEFHREDLWEIQNRHLYFRPNKSEIIARKSDEEGTMEGFHPIIPGGEFTILVDEGKSISKPVYQGIVKWTGATRRIDVTSAGEPSGHYYEMWTDRELPVSRWLVTDDDCPHIPEADKRKIISAAGGPDAPLAQQALKSRFVALAGQVVVGLDAVLRCIRMAEAGGIPWRKEELNRAGLDLSGGGDEIVLSVWNGNKQLALERPPFHDNIKTEQHIAEVLIPKYDLRLERVWADAGGLGKNMIRHIEENVTKKFGSRYGRKINMIYNNAAPIGTLKKNFASRGTEMWFQFGMMIQQAQIILLDDAKQTEQLANRYYEQAASSDKIVVEPKPKARAAGRPSPDRADSSVLALCRYEPLMAQAPAEKRTGLTAEELEDFIDDLNAARFRERKHIGTPTMEHLTGLRQRGTRISELMRRK